MIFIGAAPLGFGYGAFFLFPKKMPLVARWGSVLDNFFIFLTTAATNLLLLKSREIRETHKNVRKKQSCRKCSRGPPTGPRVPQGPPRGHGKKIEHLGIFFESLCFCGVSEFSWTLVVVAVVVVIWG